MPRNYSLLWILLLAISFNLELHSQHYFPQENWRTATPSSQGLNQQGIQKFIADLQAGEVLPPVSSFTVVKNGYMVVNENFGGYNGTRAHTLQSVTKSITSTIIGAAIQQGLIQNVDQKIVSFFPEYASLKNDDAHKQSMTLKHALIMQTGQAWTGERHLGKLNSFSEDKMKYVLDYPMEGKPGQQWYYNSGIAILLGGLIQNSTKMSTQEFAQQHLFQPLGITSARWSWSHRGIPHTGGGLFLNPSDMARIGYLYLCKGKWEGQQILPAAWVRQAFTAHSGVVDTFHGFKSRYGYMWWIFEERDNPYGHWGQFIFVIPKANMVVTFTNHSTASYAQELKPIELFFKRVLPLVN